ncbi:MAG: signal peptidase II [Candidatus Gracilibacteria bacterium]|nr:signal peptidase II [Candidatus Gracilibacteria bacterium]
MYFYNTLVGVLVIDAITKISAKLYLSDTIPLIGDFVYLQYAENPGIAFSVILPPLLLKIMTIVLIIGIFYYYKTERKLYNNFKIYDISFGCILGGALGNAYERIVYEKVIDFFAVQHFSIFNFADAAISIGAVLFIYLLLKQK